VVHKARIRIPEDMKVLSGSKGEAAIRLCPGRDVRTSRELDESTRDRLAGVRVKHPAFDLG
jgi:hypothetical protein